MNMKCAIVRAHWLLSEQFGINPLTTIRSLRGLPRYLRDLAQFRRDYAGQFSLLPCLHDWDAEAGDTTSEYFWQDLLVARKICAANPKKHVDVGSRVDGFVAHLASFREIEIFDVRPMAACIPGVTFKQLDMTQPLEAAALADAYCDSLSCLHALEHFGLGRYGDKIDHLGFARAIANMAALLETDGILYLSVPVGRERVMFNSHRIFDPRTVIRHCERYGLALTEFIVIGAKGGIESHLPADEATMANATVLGQSLGLFLFRKSGGQRTDPAKTHDN